MNRSTSTLYCIYISKVILTTQVHDKIPPLSEKLGHSILCVFYRGKHSMAKGEGQIHIPIFEQYGGLIDDNLQFLAMLVALHITPVNCWVGRVSN